MKVLNRIPCPTGATPPMAKPVSARTNSASALPMVSPSAAASFFSSTRLAPLAITRIARPEGFARNTSDFAICATEHPIAAAASAEVRVEAANSLISACSPNTASADLTRSTLSLDMTNLRHNERLLREFPGAPGRRRNGFGHQGLQPVGRHQN